MYIQKYSLTLLTLFLLSFSLSAKSPKTEPPPTLADFLLTGEATEGGMTFTLQGTAKVEGRKGGRLKVVSGAIAVKDLQEKARYTVELEGNAYYLNFKARGSYPVKFTFQAKVTDEGGWKSTGFGILSAPLRKVRIEKLPGDVKMVIPGASTPTQDGDAYESFLPPGEAFVLRWKGATPEKASKLFYSAEGICEASAAAGLLRQTHLLNLSVMQGDMKTLQFGLAGQGEVVRVEGKDILSWKILPAVQPNGERGLEVQLNQAQTKEYSLLVHTQTPLGVFPLEFEPMRLIPKEAVRYGGHFRVTNEGAVRLEILSALGLSQLSPELFPVDQRLLTNRKTGSTAPEASQSFAYRFSGSDYTLKIQADNILPEITLSEILTVHIGDSDTVLQSELELDIREAPLREFNILIPSDYSVSELDAASLSDYFVTPEPDQPNQSRLRLVFSAPLSGRQLLGLKLEKNQSLKEQDWDLPRIETQGVKSVRGYIGVTAAEGLRLSGTKTQSLTEVATAFYPKKLNGLQLAFRIKDENWELTLNAERLDLTIQADSLHLFSIGEGIAYGSSVMNFFIVGAPVSELNFAAPDAYGNVEFIGQEVRNWKRDGNQYKVFLHTPQSGAYTLLATYDSRFNPHGESLDFSGLRPMNTQSEQGTLIVTSEHYFRQPSDELEKLSPALIEVENEEIPAEYRLLYDAPILASYQYTARPFEAELHVLPYSQSVTVGQVIDYAKLETHISTKGEVLTNHHYLLKSKGATHLPVSLQKNAKLWNAIVNGKKVTPISGERATLIPLPQNADPNTLISIDLKLATAGKETNELSVSTPAVEAPVLLTDWIFKAEPGYRLDFIAGNIAPRNVVHPTNGFTWLHNLIGGEYGRRPMVFIAGAFLSAFASMVLIQLARSTKKTWRDGQVQVLGFLSLTLCGIAVILAMRLGNLIPEEASIQETGNSILEFRAPVQLAGAQLQVSLENVELEEEEVMASTTSWTTIIGGLLWIGGVPLLFMKGGMRALGNLLVSAGWICLLYSLLIKSNGEQYFSTLLVAYFVLHTCLPLFAHLYKIPRGSSSVIPASSSVPGAALLALCLLVMPETSEAKFILFGKSKSAPEPASEEVAPNADVKSTPVTPNISPPVILPPKPVEIPVETKVNSVSHKIHIQGNRAKVTYSVKWDATTGQDLFITQQPAVVTGGDWDEKYFKLRQILRNGVGTYTLKCLRTKEVDMNIHYEQTIAVTKESWHSIQLPLVTGLLNTVEIKIEASDILIECPQAISMVTREDKATGHTTASATLMNAAGAIFQWRPRSRDIRMEDTLYYGELEHLYTPTAGIIEGLHNIRIRPAQGQVRSMSVQVPGALTITDVAAEQMQGWRFDPDTRLLDLHFEPGHTQPFTLQVRSQVAAKPLPYEETVAPITLRDAAGQVGLVGIATGAEVQLGDVKTERLSPINLEDFPKAMLQQITLGKNLTLRRSFRYSDLDANLQLNALPVKPDIRVQTQETLSIGEDRIVLASDISVNITRTGIFKLTFELPEGMDVESLSGPALSHWTELKTDQGRSLTLHLRGKTLGQTSFHISLAGTGISSGEELWNAPRLLIREASKQEGQLQVVPEQGMRLNVQNREGLTQVDPKKAGILQKGVLVFRLLQNRWSLQFSIEKVEPWIQASVLQEVQIREGLHESQANIEYSIENAGIKTLQFQLPENAVGVRFRSKALADSYRPENGKPGQWEVKLSRRYIGKLQLHLSYQTLHTEEAETLPAIQGILLENINLQRGFLTLKTGSRLELQLAELPPALKSVEWQTVPRNLKRGISDRDIHHTFRVLESVYQLPIQVIRHEVEDVLPARVQSVKISSVLSEAGILLTEVVLKMQPGSKRHLGLTLPNHAKFWSAFVNKKSVWPWKEGPKILIPMEEGSVNQSSEIKFLYTLEVQSMNAAEVQNLLLGPSFDLPLEKISWNIHLPEYWTIEDTEGSTLELVETEEPQLISFSIAEYLKTEAHLRQQQYEEAETLLNKSNDLLAQGEQRLARQALQSAWSLSQADRDFNEDARVQLQNLKTQQALIGLANRRNYYLNDNLGQLEGAPAVSQAPLPYLGPNKAKYTQQEAQQVLEQNTAEVNKGLEQLASCLIGHQDAALANPEAIRANLPKQGQALTFTRSLLVNTDTDLRIQFSAKRPEEKKGFLNLGVLLVGFIIILGMSTPSICKTNE